MTEDLSEGKPCLGCADLAFKLRNASHRLTAPQTDTAYRELRAYLSRTLYGGEPEGGRGRSLDDVVSIERPRGLKSRPILTQEFLDASGRWLQHLVTDGIRTPEQLRAHLEEQPETLRQAAGEELLRAFRMVQHRFQSLRAVEVDREGAGAPEPSTVSQARGSCISETAKREVLASLANVSPEAVKKAQQRGWPAARQMEEGSHQGVGLPPSSAGSGRISVDLEAFNRKLSRDED